MTADITALIFRLRANAAALDATTTMKTTIEHLREAADALEARSELLVRAASVIQGGISAVKEVEAERDAAKTELTEAIQLAARNLDAAGQGWAALDERDATIAKALAETGDDARTDGPGEARARITRIRTTLSRGARPAAELVTCPDCGCSTPMGAHFSYCILEQYDADQKEQTNEQ